MVLTKSIAASVSDFRWQVTANHRRLTDLCDIVRRNSQVKLHTSPNRRQRGSRNLFTEESGSDFFTNFNYAFVFRNDASTTEGRTTSFFVTFREIHKDFNN